MTTPTAGQAPTTPPATDPAGQAPTNPATTPPQETRPQDPPWVRDGQPFDPARAWALIENLRADLAATRTGQAPATPTPPAPPEAPAPPAPSGGEGLAAQLDALRAQLARERAGRRHGLDDDLVDLLGTGTDEQIEARAAALAARLAPPGGQPTATASPVPRRPVEQLRGGGDPTAAPEETDPRKLADLIRSRTQF